MALFAAMWSLTLLGRAQRSCWQSLTEPAVIALERPGFPAEFRRLCARHSLACTLCSRSSSSSLAARLSAWVCRKPAMFCLILMCQKRLSSLIVNKADVALALLLRIASKLRFYQSAATQFSSWLRWERRKPALPVNWAWARPQSTGFCPPPRRACKSERT